MGFSHLKLGKLVRGEKDKGVNGL
jgi:hypothetical protein